MDILGETSPPVINAWRIRRAPPVRCAPLESHQAEPEEARTAAPSQAPPCRGRRNRTTAPASYQGRDRRDRDETAHRRHLESAGGAQRRDSADELRVGREPVPARSAPSRRRFSSPAARKAVAAPLGPGRTHRTYPPAERAARHRPPGSSEGSTLSERALIEVEAASRPERLAMQAPPGDRRRLPDPPAARRSRRSGGRLQRQLNRRRGRRCDQGRTQGCVQGRGQD